jgi:hypothetical protein
MKYRKYISKINIAAALLIALGFSGCASQTTNQKSDSKQEEGDSRKNPFDGREPASMRGNFSWLNEVEDDFGRIAAETSSRAVASQNQHEVLLKNKDWSFSYLPKTNHFYVALQGTQYQMVQTKIDDGERFAFAAEGQAENPLTFSVVKGEGRAVASGTSEKCEAEISFWSKKSKSYVTEHKAVEGKPCERMLSLLKDYVP